MDEKKSIKPLILNYPNASSSCQCQITAIIDKRLADFERRSNKK